VQWGKYGIQYYFSSIRINSKPPLRINYSLVFLFTATLMILTAPLAVTAGTVSILSDELKWQMVFISSAPACSNYHYQMMQTYYDVVVEYLKLYQVENDSYDPLCITEKKYYSEYESPDDLALIIIVYDDDLGQKELHANKMGGLYTHSGIDRTQNHAIIICDCSNFYYSSPVWILSHELSHFVLYYNDLEMSVIEDMIHANDVKYDQCLEDSTVCKSNAIKMQAGPGGYLYSVMPIYESAIGTNAEKLTTTDNSSLILSDVSKILTKWWTSDIISDEHYSNIIGYLVDSDVISSHESTELILTDGPLDDVVKWDELLEEITPTYWDREQKVDNDSKQFLSIIPSNLRTNDEKLISEDVTSGLPEWFKETASWWAQDKITDKEFKKSVEYLVKEGILRPHTSNVFQNLADNAESLRYVQAIEAPSPESLVDAVNESTAESETIFTVDTKGIQGLIDFVNSMTDSGDLKERDGTRLMKNLDTAVTAFDIGKINNGCSNLENYFTVVNYLTDTNKIVQELGQTLIDAGDEVRLDSC